MLVPQTGYYVYYEKNPEMRRYMMEEANRFVHIVEQEDDRVLRNIRGVIQEKEEKKKEREVGERRGYGFAGLVIVLAIVFAAAAWNNKINLSRLNDQLTGIKNEIQKELNTDTTMETIGNGVVTPAGSYHGGSDAVAGSQCVAGRGYSSQTAPTSCKHVWDAYRYPGSLPANCCVADATFAILSLFGFRRFTTVNRCILIRGGSLVTAPHHASMCGTLTGILAGYITNCYIWIAINSLKSVNSYDILFLLESVLTQK